MSSIHPSIADEKTPVDGAPNEDPFEMLSKQVADVARDTKVAIDVSREANEIARKTFDIVLEMHESNKKIEKRMDVVEAYHIWLPLIAIGLAAIAMFVAVFGPKL